MRADKFLWCVRIYKSRSMATDACKNQKISINNVALKPAQALKINDLLTVKKASLVFVYRIVQFPDNRVSAKLVEQYLTDVTPPEMAQKNNTIQTNKRENHMAGIVGRPTKLNRRKLDEWKKNHFGFND